MNSQQNEPINTLNQSLPECSHSERDAAKSISPRQRQMAELFLVEGFVAEMRKAFLDLLERDPRCPAGDYEVFPPDARDWRLIRKRVNAAAVAAVFLLGLNVFSMSRLNARHMRRWPDTAIVRIA